MNFIEKWVAFCRKNGIGEVRLRKYQAMANTLSAMGKRPIEDTLTDMKKLEAVVAGIDSSHYAAYTKSDFKTFLKQLWKFHHGLDQDDKPREIKWIKSTMKDKNKKLPKGLLTDEEIKTMLKVAKSPRDKAIIMLLYECGLRISELCALRKTDIEFIEQGVRVLIPEGTKTGSRSILGIDCAPFMAAHMASHPLKDDDDFVFVGQHWTKQRGRKWLIYSQFGDRGVAKMLRLTAADAGIRRRIYPHLFRHTAATKLAKFLSEQELKAYFGWTAGSDMASVYVHLSGKDVDDALMRMHGQLAPKKQEDKLAPIFCERCTRKNAADATRCDKCGLPFDKVKAVKDMLSMQGEIAELRKMINDIAKKESDDDVDRQVKAAKEGLARKKKANVDAKTP